MCAARASPAVTPRPGTTLSTPGGSPTSSAMSAIRNALRLDSSDGLSTMVFPLARAGPILDSALNVGKFHGTIAPTTPRGTRTLSASVDGCDERSASVNLSHASAYQRMRVEATATSPRAPSTGIPISRASSNPSSSAWSSSASARAKRTCARARGPYSLHGPLSNAVRAASTATSMSSASPQGTSTMPCPVAGLTDVNESTPRTAVRLPSINARGSNERAVARACQLSGTASPCIRSLRSLRRNTVVTRIAQFRRRKW